MKKIFLLILIIISISGRSQSTVENEKKAILEKVALFFSHLKSRAGDLLVLIQKEYKLK